jgi:hypothetical protein
MFIADVVDVGVVDVNLIDVNLFLADDRFLVVTGYIVEFYSVPVSIVEYG